MIKKCEELGIKKCFFKKNKLELIELIKNNQINSNNIDTTKLDLYNINYNKFLEILVLNDLNYYVEIKHIELLKDNEKEEEKLKIKLYIKDLNEDIKEYIKKSKHYEFICCIWNILTDNINDTIILESFDDSGFIITNKSKKIYLLHPIIINKFYILYEQNEQNNKVNVNIPSKINNKYWISHSLNYGNIGTGKWLLFYNKKIKDKYGLTELDKNYQQLLEKYNLTLYGIKCSTNLDNPNTSKNNTDGVIIIYTSDNDKYSIIKDIEKIIKLKPKIYWKANNNGNYTKNNVKSSNYEYITI